MRRFLPCPKCDGVGRYFPEKTKYVCVECGYEYGTDKDKSVVSCSYCNCPDSKPVGMDAEGQG